MKFTSTPGLFLITLSAILLTGCKGDQTAKKRIQEQHEKWERSLSDSVAATRRQLDSVRTRLETLGHEINSQLTDFDCIENPREVEKYYLPRVKGLSYPLERNGIVGRLTASETLELIAVHRGAPFESIRVECAEGAAQSQQVPYDKALNYRIGDTSTVTFSGASADSVGMLIGTHKCHEIFLVYLGANGRTVGKTKLPATDIQSVSAAWRLASLRKDIFLTEKRLSVYSRKLQILEQRSRIEATD